jgi:hypothetical protein
VAAAYVTVTPNVSDFAAALDEELGGLSLSVVVTPDVSDFAAAVDEALGGLTVSVTVIPDVSDFAAAVEEQVGGLSVSVAVTPDASDFEASVLEQAGGITVPVSVVPEAAGAADLGDMLGEQTGTVALPVTVTPDVSGFEEALGETTGGITVSVRTVPDASDFQEQLDDQVGTPVVGVSLRPALADLAEHIGDSLAGAIPVPVVPSMGDFAGAVAEESGGITVPVDVVPSPESLDALPARIEEGAGGLQITADVVPVLGDISSALEDQASAGAVAIPVTADIEPLEEQLAEARDLVGELAGQVYALELTADDDEAVSVLGTLRDELLSVTGTVYSVSVSADDLEGAQSALAGISEQLAGVQQEAQAAAGPAAALGEALTAAGDTSGLQADSAALGDVQEAASSAGAEMDSFRQLTADAFGSVDYSAATAALNGVAAAASDDAELIEEDFAGIEDRLASVSSAVSALDADFLRMANADFSYATDAELADMTSSFENLYGELESVQSEFAGLQGQLSAAGGEFEGMDAGLGSVSSALAGVEGSLTATSAQLEATAGSWYDEEEAASRLGTTLEGLPGALEAVDAQLTASIGAREASLAALNGEAGAMETLTSAAPAAADAAGGLSGVLGELAGRMSYMAVDPFMWMMGVPLVIEGVTDALRALGSESDTMVDQLTQQDHATGYNISGYQKLASQLGATADSYETLLQKMNDTGESRGAGSIQYEIDQLTAGQQAALNVVDSMGKLQDAYGLTEQQSELLGEASGVAGTKLEGTGTAASDAMADIEAYANANLTGSKAVSQLTQDQEIFSSSAFTATDRIGDMDNAFTTLAGNFISVQTAQLNVTGGFDSLEAASQAAGASMKGTNTQSVGLQQSFYAQAGAIEQAANAMVQNGDSAQTVTGYINTQITSLSKYEGGSKNASSAVQDLKKWEDSLTGSLQTQGSYLSGTLSNDLDNAILKYSGTQTAVDNYADALVDFGKNSPQAKNAQDLLTDSIVKGGLAAGQSTGQIAQMISQMEKIPLKEAIQITLNAEGKYTVTGTESAPLTNVPGTNIGPTVTKASGGLITGGSGRGRADDIHAMLSHGEYVVQAGAVSKYGTGFLDSVNAGHFADGGLASSYSGEASGMGTWLASNYDSTNTVIIQAVEAAMTAAIAAGQVGSGSSKAPVNVNFFGTQMPTPEQQQALMTNLSAAIGVA